MTALALLGGPKAVKQPEPHYRWPVITEATREAVLRQLENSISIYDRSGIIESLELRIEEELDIKHALLFNSGTSALFAMLMAINLQAGDEVICPVYTFFATVSSIFFTGAIPILADCDHTGSIDPNQVREKITPRTRAVIVTPMWGIPANLTELREICDTHGLMLLEDISHAYGALYKKRKVGTFGVAAAFSLQGQKTLTGGEGGVLITNDDNMFYRALAVGHYNKRCLKEIPPTHPLHEYGVTGFGLKLRIHPLAAAIAYQQMDGLPEILEGRRRFAERLYERLRRIPGLDIIEIPEGVEPSWYALIFHLAKEISNKITMDEIYAACRAEGCVELDRPKSTAPLHMHKLFQDPVVLFPNYQGIRVMGDFPVAEDFYARAFKLPVWHSEEDRGTLDSYADAIEKVMCHFIGRK